MYHLSIYCDHLVKFRRSLLYFIVDCNFNIRGLILKSKELLKCLVNFISGCNKLMIPNAKTEIFCYKIEVYFLWKLIDSYLWVIIITLKLMVA